MLDSELLDQQLDALGLLSRNHRDYGSFTSSPANSCG